MCLAIGCTPHCPLPLLNYESEKLPGLWLTFTSDSTYSLSKSSFDTNSIPRNAAIFESFGKWKRDRDTITFYNWKSADRNDSNRAVIEYHGKRTGLRMQLDGDTLLLHAHAEDIKY